MVLGVHSCLLFGAVANAKIDALMFAFRHRNPGRHFFRLKLLVLRFDVDELKQLHPIQPSLRILDEAAAIDVAAERQLTLNDPIAHRLLPEISTAPNARSRPARR
jgi:hypothetical protein